jgi:tetratricopeptide (TPR) repeat protein
LAINLGRTHYFLAVLRQKTGPPTEALDRLAQARQVLEGVRGRDPSHGHARMILSEVHWKRAVLWRQRGQYQEALADWDRAIALADQPARDQFRRGRACDLARVGDHTGAVAELDALTQGRSVPGDVWYDQACGYALASVAAARDEKLPSAERDRLAEEYVGRALEMLGKATTAGSFQHRGRVEHLKKDDDLESLRSRPDFRKLLRELEENAIPDER